MPYKTRLEKFIEDAEAAGLVCCACAKPLKLELGGWRLTGGRWEHKCGPGPDAPWHPAVTRRLFECGLLRPITQEEYANETEAAGLAENTERAAVAG